jgi:aminopeptidase N
MCNLLFALLLAAASTATAQTTRSNAVNVEHYNINAEINPRTQALTATVEMRVTAVDDRILTIPFDFNDALSVKEATDESGARIGVNKGPGEFQVTVALPKPLARNASTTLRFVYDGVLAGQEESPVYGIRFASIKNDYAYLLYPARWFPVGGYTADRYTMNLKVTAPEEYRVLSNGNESKSGTTWSFETKTAGFPGNIALVRGEPQRVSSQGVTSAFYFRNSKSMAQAYGDEAGKVMGQLTSFYGLAPSANLTFVETEKGAPSGYSTPGLVFLSPSGIGSNVNTRLLVNQIARQWWSNQVSAATRNHLWITNGLARYSEALYLENTVGAGALETENRDLYIEALTVDQPPLIQSARLEDYSPEFNAATSGKGAAVYNMLRFVMGDKVFGDFVKQLAVKFSGKTVSTEQLKNLASELAGQDMGYFFIQWIESQGAPEFKLEYTVFRTAKGFRINGKVINDLDTFRMPVQLRIETEGNPEMKTVEVIGASSEFAVETFGKPQRVILDPNSLVLRWSNPIRVAVAIKKGEQFAEVNEFGEALKEYQKALDVNRNSSLAHYRVGELFFLQTNYQAAANEFREALQGDLEPKWVEVWGHINLGQIFDITSQRERAVNEYNLAIRTKDDTQGAQAEAAKYLKEPYKRQVRPE